MIEARTKNGVCYVAIPLDRLHAVRVALQPVSVGAPQSAATKATREELDRALAAPKAVKS